MINRKRSKNNDSFSNNEQMLAQICVMKKKQVSLVVV
jgi:hypothetical protein